MREEQLQLYEKCQCEGFSLWQMFEIELGFTQGFTIEQIKIFARKELNPVQMSEIRCGLNQGLTIEQVSMYARPELDRDQMAEIRKMLFKKEPFERIKTKIALMLLES